jgi:hypothetical protein
MISENEDCAWRLIIQKKKRDLLLGCSVPLVLRRDGDDEEYNDQFSLVGEYYTDGVMNGEAIALLDKRNYALEKISLV